MGKIRFGNVHDSLVTPRLRQQVKASLVQMASVAFRVGDTHAATVWQEASENVPDDLTVWEACAIIAVLNCSDTPREPFLLYQQHNGDQVTDDDYPVALSALPTLDRHLATGTHAGNLYQWQAKHC
jgi:hypothetical protein